jgi:hypothetical protein
LAFKRLLLRGARRRCMDGSGGRGGDATPQPDDTAAEAVECALEALHRALHHADAQARLLQRGAAGGAGRVAAQRSVAALTLALLGAMQGWSREAALQRRLTQLETENATLRRDLARALEGGVGSPRLWEGNASSPRLAEGAAPR